MSIKDIQIKLVNKIGLLSETESDMEKMAYGATALEKLARESFSTVLADETWVIGTPGKIGFGVAACPEEHLPTGWRKMYGHEDILHENYGNVEDGNGSVMVWIPKYFYKIENNTYFTSHKEATGYVIERTFIDGGDRAGIFVDKFGCGNVGGKFISKRGIDPCSTHGVHNPIGNLNNSPTNNYGGLYAAVQTRGTGYSLTTVFTYHMLAMLAYAHGQAAQDTSTCAYVDVLPKLPKGNLGNALHDVNDTSVSFTESGYSNCALTGSGSPFAKTTHNGQSCGVADLNGNMWEVASGLIKTNETNGIFKILKTSVSSSSLTDNIIAYKEVNYDDLDMTSLVSGNTGTTYLGNGTNQVFAMETDTNSDNYKKTSAGMPNPAGVGAGTTQFGNDYIYRYWRNQLTVLVGGAWGHSSAAGVFAMNLSSNRTASSHTVGGRASFLV